MATKRDEDIAAGSVAEGGHEVKIPEGIVKPKDTKVDSEHHPRGAEQSQPMYETSQRIAAGDARASQARIPEGIMKPVPEKQSGSAADASSAIAAGRPLDAGNVKVPEAVVKPTSATAPAASSPLTPDGSGNVAGGQPLNASGFNVDESETKIPEGIMKPNSGLSANIAAGHPVDASGNQSAAEHAKVPEGIMEPSMSS